MWIFCNNHQIIISFTWCIKANKLLVALNVRVQSSITVVFICKWKNTNEFPTICQMTNKTSLYEQTVLNPCVYCLILLFYLAFAIILWFISILCLLYLYLCNLLDQTFCLFLLDQTCPVLMELNYLFTYCRTHIPHFKNNVLQLCSFNVKTFFTLFLYLIVYTIFPRWFSVFKIIYGLFYLHISYYDKYFLSDWMNIITVGKLFLHVGNLYHIFFKEEEEMTNNRIYPKK